MAKFSATNQPAKKGRPAGRKNKIKLPELKSPDVEKYLDLYIPQALRTVVELMDAKDERTRLLAAKVLIDRRIPTLRAVDFQGKIEQIPEVNIRFWQGAAGEVQN